MVEFLLVVLSVVHVSGMYLFFKFFNETGSIPHFRLSWELVVPMGLLLAGVSGLGIILLPQPLWLLVLSVCLVFDIVLGFRYLPQHIKAY